MKVTLFFAAYKERETVNESVSAIYGYAEKNLGDYEILGIDDGSGDGTYEALVKASKKFPMVVDRNPVNMGLGATLRRGFRKASGDVIIAMDSDLSYPLEDIPKLIGKIGEGYDLVVASPFSKQGKTKNVPLFRLLLSRAGSLIYSVFIGAGISCYTGGFRAYKKDLARKLDFKQNRFGAQVEIIWLAHRLGYRIAEIPSVLETRDRKGRPSSFKIMRGIMDHLELLSTFILADLKDRLGIEKIRKD